MSLEGIVSKRADAAYAPGNRGLWLKVKCLHREEFVVVGWTNPEGRRPWLGALLLAYYDPYGRLVYAGRAGSGINTAELERLWRRLQPLACSPRVAILKKRNDVSEASTHSAMMATRDRQRNTGEGPRSCRHG
jgi:ATP-dependent DNA ligase